ncbi:MULTISPECIES: alpha/beta hydrolase [Streptomyces]
MDITVPVPGGMVWAQDTGGEGMPVVLLHPGVGDSRIWDGVVPLLAPHHRVIRYDARGFGRSPAPTVSYSNARDLAVVLDHFGLERAVLAGSSLGGATAVSVALAAPGRVAGLGLLCPGVTGYPELSSPAVTARIGELAKAGDVDGLVELGLRTWGAAGSGTDDEAAAQLRAAVPAWFATHPYVTQDAPAFDRLPELDVPCVLALGEQDQDEVVRCNEAMAARIPGCRLVRWPHCDHFPSLRDPGAVAGLLLELAAGPRSAP